MKHDIGVVFDDVLKCGNVVLNAYSNTHLKSAPEGGFDNSLMSGLDVSCQGIFY